MQSSSPIKNVASRRCRDSSKCPKQSGSTTPSTSHPSVGAVKDHQHRSNDKTGSGRRCAASTPPASGEVRPNMRVGTSGQGSSLPKRPQRSEQTSEASSKATSSPMPIQNAPIVHGKWGPQWAYSKSKIPGPPKSGPSHPLSVLVYDPYVREAAMSHWSLFLQTGEDGSGILRDVVGTNRPNTSIRRRHDNAQPRLYGQLRQDLPVARVHNVTHFRHVVESTAISTLNEEGSSQDWVYRTLLKLRHQGVIDEDSFFRIKQRLVDLVLEERQVHGLPPLPAPFWRYD